MAYRKWVPGSGSGSVENPSGNIDRVAAMAFSPDGKTLVTAAENAVGVWDLEPVLFSIHGRVSFSPDGRTIATGDNGRL